jgi:urease accessory protein
MRSLQLSSFAFDRGREGEAHLVAEFAGGRTTLRRQRAGYPFHVTRGFYLDPPRPDLLTLYMQSASGGLYAGDRLKLDVEVGTNAALHLTTQAATVVHHGRDALSAQQLRVRVGRGAFCAISSEPYVLFPGANLSLDTIAEVEEDAVLFIADGMAVHDPRGSDGAFAQYASRLRVMRPNSRLLLQDCGRIAGSELRSSPFGGMAAVGTASVIAPPGRLAAIKPLMQAVGECGCLAGASEAPNDAGLVLRMLAPDGGALARGIEAAFHAAGHAALGAALSRRRK